MSKQEIMERSLFKEVNLVKTDGEKVEGYVKVYETAYDNDNENEASICILTNDGECLCLFESEIETIKIE